MSVSRGLLAGCALAALLPCSAQAAVEPADLWASLKRQSAETGVTVTAQERREGADLVLRDLVLTLPAAEGPPATFTLPELRLADDGDAVRVTASETMTLRVTAPAMPPAAAPPAAAPAPAPADGATPAAVPVTVAITQSGLASRVTGEPDRYDVTFSADRLGFEGKPEGEGPGPVFSGAIEAIEGTETIDMRAGRTVESRARAAAAQYKLRFEDPQTRAIATTENRFETLTLATKMHSPAGVPPADPAAAAKAGGRLSVEIAAQSATGTTASSGAPEGEWTMTTRAGPVTGRFGLESAGARYRMDGTSVQVEGRFGAMPVAGRIGAMRFDLAMPLVADEAAQDFAIEARLEEVTLADGLWAVFDPQGKLSHAPAAVVIDLDGKARLAADLGAEAAQGGAMPFSPELVTLRELTLRALGAELGGKGQFTFVPKDGQPMAQPVGILNLRGQGLTAAMDALVAAGLVPQEQIAGLRMMLGLFTTPAGEDTVTSTIEYREDGGLYANGQRLQ